MPLTKLSQPKKKKPSKTYEMKIVLALRSNIVFNIITKILYIM